MKKIKINKKIFNICLILIFVLFSTLAFVFGQQGKKVKVIEQQSINLPSKPLVWGPRFEVKNLKTKDPLDNIYPIVYCPDTRVLINVGKNGNIIYKYYNENNYGIFISPKGKYFLAINFYSKKDEKGNFKAWHEYIMYHNNGQIKWSTTRDVDMSYRHTAVVSDVGSALISSETSFEGPFGLLMYYDENGNLLLKIDKGPKHMAPDPKIISSNGEILIINDIYGKYIVLNKYGTEKFNFEAQNVEIQNNKILAFKKYEVKIYNFNGVVENSFSLDTSYYDARFFLSKNSKFLLVVQSEKALFIDLTANKILWEFSTNIKGDYITSAEISNNNKLLVITGNTEVFETSPRFIYVLDFKKNIIYQNRNLPSPCNAYSGDCYVSTKVILMPNEKNFILFLEGDKKIFNYEVTE